MSDIAASAEAIASRLAAEHAERRPFAVMPELSGDLALAYAAQDALLARCQAQGAGPIVGWKIGLTTPHMQAMAGIDQPIGGAILERRRHSSGVRVAAADHLRLGVECEIALRLGRSLPLDEPYDPDRVLACLDAACVAFELIEDRNADYRALEAATMIADNSWNAGVVLGPPCPTAGLESLLGLEGRLFVDGELVDRGRSDSVGGNPVSVVDWIARSLAARGRALEPGQWVMTGSVVTTKFAKAGQSYRFEMDRLGSVAMDVL